MEHNLSMEIVDVLMKEELHPRLIAKKIGGNHMTVSRRLAELAAQNVVDCKTRGKNKTYFIKKTLEARSFLAMSEYYKLNRTLATYPLLHSVTGAIERNPDIRLAILFGSYAKGTAKPGSDIDVYLEGQDSTIKKEVEMLHTDLSVKIGSFNRNNPLIKEIEKNHVILKGVEEYYEKTKFFS